MVFSHQTNENSGRKRAKKLSMVESRNAHARVPGNVILTGCGADRDRNRDPHNAIVVKR